jgi:hypothetical protein
MTTVPGSIPKIILDCIALNKSKSIKIIVNYIVGPLVFLLLAVFIYWQITRQHNWRSSLQEVLKAVKGPQQWKLWLVLALMPVNWGIEARKWQLALGPVGGIRYRDAFKAVFTGAAVGSFTPNRMGEYMGRILYIKEGHRTQAIALTIACSMAQLMTTLVIGLAGIAYVSLAPHRLITGSHHMQLALNILLAIVSVLLVSLTFIYFGLPRVVNLVMKIPLARKYKAYINVLENFDTRSLILADILCLWLNIAWCSPFLA